MCLQGGGVYNDKPTTIERFKTVYQELSQGVKNRLVLENDEMCFNVDDLLPICEELNIPLVLGTYDQLPHPPHQFTDACDHIQTITMTGFTHHLNLSKS